MTEPMRVSMWSGPRNLSTALMYAFRQRADTTVIDEPLYGHYLARSGLDHPMRDEVLASLPTDADAAITAMFAVTDTAIVFFKNMAHHTLGLDLDRFGAMRNTLLTRDPRSMVPSLLRGFPAAGLPDTGLPQSVAILEWILERGERPIVLDAGEILHDPRSVIGQWCDRLGIPFDDAMLSWPAGPKPEDGVWAPHWYAGVHASTGFGPIQQPPSDLPANVAALIDDCVPIYERLFTYAITT